MIVKIDKFGHYSHGLMICPTLKGKVSGTVSFYGDFSYSIPNQKDTNKLIGLSDNFHHHQDSVRIGWRWDVKMKSIEIMGIFYVSGKRTITSICYIKPDRLHNFSVEIHKGNYWIKFGNSVVTHKRESRWRFFRYHLLPFFGGKTRAPKEFKFNLNINY